MFSRVTQQQLCDEVFTLLDNVMIEKQVDIVLGEKVIAHLVNVERMAELEEKVT